MSSSLNFPPDGAIKIGNLSTHIRQRLLDSLLDTGRAPYADAANLDIRRNYLAWSETRVWTPNTTSLDLYTLGDLEGETKFHKFKPGDIVEIVESGSGFSYATGTITMILETGIYGRETPGYKVLSNIEGDGNVLTGNFDSMHGQNSFKLVKKAEEWGFPEKHGYIPETPLEDLWLRQMFHAKELQWCSRDDYMPSDLPYGGSRWADYDEGVYYKTGGEYSSVNVVEEYTRSAGTVKDLFHDLGLTLPSKPQPPYDHKDWVDAQPKINVQFSKPINKKQNEVSRENLKHRESKIEGTRVHRQKIEAKSASRPAGSRATNLRRRAVARQSEVHGERIFLECGGN